MILWKLALTYTVTSDKILKYLSFYIEEFFQNLGFGLEREHGLILFHHVQIMNMKEEFAFELVATRGSSYKSDVAIDDLSYIGNQSCNPITPAPPTTTRPQPPYDLKVCSYNHIGNQSCNPITII